MRKATAVVLLLLSFAGMFLAGSWYSRRSALKPGGAGDCKVLYYVDPMNPSHTSDKPGPAPCGMPMEPVYAEDGKTAGSSLSPGGVTISPQKQQLLGVRVGPVEETSRKHAFRTIGRVAPVETRVHRVLAGAPGFIREVSEVTTDSYVTKDQWLASFSSPDSVPSIQNYIVALNAMDRLRGDNAGGSAENLEGSGNYQARVDKLLELGIPPAQMEEIKATRAVPRRTKILSPVDGFVLARNISLDQKFDRGFEWYRIADLSRVWVVADVFEREAPYVKPGMSAKISLPHRGTVFDATVTQAAPQFDAAARTLKVRLELENPENVLRPDMFVDVELLVTFPPAVTVPADAVLDSGQRKTVFVDLGEGRFEPRAVETGWRFDEQVEILKGLVAGERIVTSGNFLIDSESRMKLAAQGLFGMPEVDPTCGAEVYPEKAKAAGLMTELEGKAYYFCSPTCKTQFEKDHPSQMTMSGEHAGHDHHGKPAVRQKEQPPAGIARDPVCNMYTQEKKSKAEKLVREYRGKSYYFCSPQCLKEFDKNPERYGVKGQE
jgi:membrane fusion protein, copper/silver efflux system